MKHIENSLVPPEHLAPNPDNPRMIDYENPTPADYDIAGSLLHIGQLQDIVVRLLDGDGVPSGADPEFTLDYQILAGERRWFTSILAGLPIVAIKVVTCTDDEAFQITVIENLHRVDIHPLDEARCLRKMLDRRWTYEQIGVEVDKSPEWVARRLSLSQLCPEITKAVYEKGSHANLGVSHLELLARYPLEDQQEMWDTYLQYQANGMTVAELRKYLLEREHRLDSAPWALDARVGARLPCEGCPKRCSANPLLFQESKREKDRCWDPHCWNDKMVSWLNQHSIELGETLDQPNPVPIVNPYELMPYSHVAKLKHTMESWSVRWLDDDADRTDAKPAYDCKVKKVRWYKSSRPTSSSSSLVPASEQTDEERFARAYDVLTRKRLAYQIGQLLDALPSSLPSWWALPTAPIRMLDLMVAFGNGSAHPGMVEPDGSWGRDEAVKYCSVKRADDRSMERAWSAWRAAVERNFSHWRQAANITGQVKSATGFATWLTTLLGRSWDVSAAWEAHPAPKSWAVNYRQLLNEELQQEYTLRDITYT